MKKKIIFVIFSVAFVLLICFLFFYNKSTNVYLFNETDKIFLVQMISNSKNDVIYENELANEMFIQSVFSYEGSQSLYYVVRLRGDTIMNQRIEKPPLFKKHLIVTIEEKDGGFILRTASKFLQPMFQ
jgi:hypothetical protein